MNYHDAKTLRYRLDAGDSAAFHKSIFKSVSLPERRKCRRGRMTFYNTRSGAFKPAAAAPCDILIICLQLCTTLGLYKSLLKEIHYGGGQDMYVRTAGLF
ncbi:unnamed protein product [Macrosiphum euphorbiae]|uniref:Uncharacterized protein n=1 Tax=Macrosiphum euphorbiae TaxID=13131 RepID=A0AAV0XNJ0_9HEMI|nr:unnamed protein product [Macrosiphum euphorbiae]